MSEPVRYSGSDWIIDARKHWKGHDLPISPLGIAVADLLGDVFFGIYHLDTGALMRVKWQVTYCITFTLSHKSLATFDDDKLTRLVVLCHDRMIRLSIEGSSSRSMRLMFWQRHSREGSIDERYPTIEDHIKRIREDYQ